MLKPRKLVALRKKKPRIREFSSDADETIKDFNQATDKLDTSAIVDSWFKEFAEPNACRKLILNWKIEGSEPEEPKL